MLDMVESNCANNIKDTMKHINVEDKAKPLSKQFFTLALSRHRIAKPSTIGNQITKDKIGILLNIN